jgi:phosphoglycolate phosphatase
MKILVLFDIDGTILSLKRGISKGIFSKFIREIFNRDINDTHLPDFSGKTDLLILREISENLGHDFNVVKNQIPLLWDKMLVEFRPYCNPENIVLMPGIVALLERLGSNPSLALGLLTGNFRENAYLKLRAFSLEKFFPIGAFGSDNEDRNQLPQLAINRANIHYKTKNFSKSNSIIIGDSTRDIECAHSNNMPVICPLTGSSDFQQLSDFGPEYILKDFSDTAHVENLILNHFNIK